MRILETRDKDHVISSANHHSTFPCTTRLRKQFLSPQIWTNFGEFGLFYLSRMCFGAILNFFLYSSLWSGTFAVFFRSFDFWSLVARIFLSLLWRLPAAAQFVVLGRLHFRPLQMALLTQLTLHVLPLDHRIRSNIIWNGRTTMIRSF